MINKKVIYFFTGFLLLMSRTTISTTEYWNWQTLDIKNITFPENFEWGTTALAYEVEGNSTNNTWYAWETHIQYDGTPFAQERSDIGCDQWNHYKDDIQKMKTVGLKTYCFSLEWSKIEPKQGCFDENALQHYVDLCDELNANGIKPIVILKDNRDPLWFGYLGGFEKESNITIFEHYCLKVFEALKNKVSYWITFWAPEMYATQGYLRGIIPPGIKHMHRAVTVLKNELEAHVRIYKSIKSIEGGSTAQIGIIKHVHQLEPWYPWDRIGCRFANILTNNLFYSFFTTGIFECRLPLPGRLGGWVNHRNSFAPKSLDFVGINYYSHGYIKNFKHIGNPHEIPTDIDGFTMYPEGLYFAIKKVAENLTKKLDIPIYITQNGIATNDESIRDLFFKRHLYALSKALKDGYDIKGYNYYTFIDCYSWNSYNKKFGLFAVDRDTLERTEKSGAQYYFDIINKHQ